MNIVVIGSGFGGLSAAIRLQAMGHSVTIIEKRDKLGGRAYVTKQDGFTFDGGPTIITAPSLIDELFEIAGRKTKDYVSIVKIDPFYNIRFEDGSVFHYTGDRDHVREEIKRFNPNDVAGYDKFFEKTEAIFKTGFDLIDKPFTTIMDMVKVLPDLVKLRSNRSVFDLVKTYIKDPRLQQVFSFHPLLVGGNPFQTTSIYALIHTLEQRWGVWFAMGGTGALVEALGKLFTDIGGKVMLSQEIDEISVNDATGKADGVFVGKERRFMPFDAVVSNADVAFTYMNMISPRHTVVNTPKKYESIQYSMSLFVLYFGTNKRYENIAHHEILMGPRYKELLEEIFGSKELPKDFSLYLHRPTATDPSLAPEGCDCWYVLSPVPHLKNGTDWKTQAKPYRDAIVKYLEERYMPNLSEHIVTEFSIDPLHFQSTLNSYLGSAFSVEPILTQSAWFRPHNVSEDIPNLYFVGAGTHPGAGMPGVISSAKIVANMIGEK